MGKTLNHEIYYPDGSTLPNVPVVMQTAAESVDQALSAISEAPFIVCEKTTEQFLPQTPNASLVTWDRDVWKQGIEHDLSKSPGDFKILEDGLYTINAKLSFAADNGAVVVWVNGIQRLNTWVDMGRVMGLGPKPVTISEQKLSAGDVVQIRGSVGQLVPSEMSLSIRKSAGFAGVNQ